MVDADADASAGSWRAAALQQECWRRGVSAAGMPQEWFAAVEWTAREVCRGGQVTACKRCLVQARTHIYCASCSASFCRRCLAVDKDSVWEIGFECPACVLESVSFVEPVGSHEQVLMELAEELIRTKTFAHAPSTWGCYQRCFRRVIQFMRDTKIWVFPVFEYSHARGLCLFFQHLKLSGISWATMSQYRCALVSASKSVGMTSPWERFPQLEELASGLSRELRRPVRRKEGMTRGMVLRVLAMLEARYLQYNGSSQQRLADVALRDMAALVISYWGIRRGAELWLNKQWTMGLRRCHVTFVSGSHVTLFIQAQKNDPRGLGSEVVIAWVTGSGVCVGRILQLLQARLAECGIPEEGPLFCATTSFRSGGFVMPEPGREARFQNRLRALLKRTYHELASNSVVLSRFGWHSLRRGGAEDAFNSGISMRLVMGQGRWKSEQGVRVYRGGNLATKLTVSHAT